MPSHQMSGILSPIDFAKAALLSTRVICHDMQAATASKQENAAAAPGLTSRTAELLLHAAPARRQQQHAAT
jgi:hypothetical protein